MKHKNILLASFVDPDEIDNAFFRIEKYANVDRSNVFVFKSSCSQMNDYIFTYNIDRNKNIRYNQILPDTISIHRKKETNTLFSLNAMNELIKKQNNNKLVMSYKINWEDYRNCFLLLRNGVLTIIHLELIKLNR